MEKRVNYISVILTLLLIFPLLFAACTGKVNKNINISDSIVSIPKASLPFEYEEWLNWSSNYYSDTGVEDESRFPFHSISSYSWLKDILLNKGIKEEEMHSFLLLDNNNDNFHSFIVNLSDDSYSYMRLINLSDDGKIIAELPFAQTDTTSYLKGGHIMPDMKVELYDGKLLYDEKQDRGIIINRKVAGTHQIEPDGSIQ